jgi:hypothetical protein
MPQPLHIKNARVWNGGNVESRDLYTSDIVLEKPAPNALVVDLEGYTIFPGLVNAHDHLELNHFPRTKYRDVYPNAHVWAEEVQAQLNESPFRELRAYPLEDKLFIGGLKNLLCGATTVAHHNPPHKPLFRKDFPVRVLQRYGWSHSLHFNTDQEVQDSFFESAPQTTWFIHLAEGTDDQAAAEYKWLKALNCVFDMTVLIHGVGMTIEDIEHAARHVRGLVWCPSTNMYLLGQTANVKLWLELGGTVALGSDSYLSADGDLLDEMSSALRNSSLYAAQIIDMVTLQGNRLLNLQTPDALVHGVHADFIAIRSADDDALALCQSRRADLALVVKVGVPRIGNPDVMAKFPHNETVSATLDGVPKSIHIDLARRIMKCSLKEAGLVVDAVPKSKRRLFGIAF